MTTDLAERIKTEGLPVTVPARAIAGRVAWHVKLGETVAAGQLLCTISNFDEVLSPTAGRIATIATKQGQIAAPGQTLAYIATQRTTEPATSPSAPPPIQTAQPVATRSTDLVRRRGEIVPLEVEELAPVSTTVEKPKRERVKPTVKHHTLHLATPQIEELRRLSYRLKLEQGPGAPSQSLIARAALQHFLDLDPTLQAMLIGKQEEREEREEWGSGYPRPDE